MITREIHIGNLVLGGKKPVLVQSMTNTNTMDTTATVRQTLELADAGCQLVRITARNTAEAENLKNIKQALAEKNCFVPLIADIHFQPQAAEVAARIVEKVRINPGNYSDKKLREDHALPYSESRYRQELEQICLRLKPLLDTCKEYGTAMRIGVNHGSLSDRIMWRYGDTVEGMVASAIEYIDICRYHGFGKLVLSMKSSDVKTMIYAYRLLVARMEALGYDYPLHLGVTEAGSGLEARIKSAAGIGSLMMEGIGDTIRVSLTENPVNEIPFARLLVKKFSTDKKAVDRPWKYAFEKFETHKIGGIGGEEPPVCVYPGIGTNTVAELMPDLYLNTGGQCLLASDGARPVDYLYLTPKDLDDSRLLKEHAVVGDKVHFFDFSTEEDLPVLSQKIVELRLSGNKLPLILYKKYFCSVEDLQAEAPAELACFLADGVADGICIDNDAGRELLPSLMFGILQTMGLRRSKAEFIACPTCGRTSYDVEGTLRILKQKLSHLKHLKIGVMGCIVNGPGEMADADYGYVGASAGKITLYRKKQVVLKNIDESGALDELMRLIKADGNWTEPEPLNK